MALLGNIIKVVNHIIRGDVSAGDLDHSFRSTVEQVGGAAWSEGVPEPFPAKIGLENLGELSFGNGSKEESRSVSTISVYGDMEFYVYGGTEIAPITVPPPPIPVVAEALLDTVTIYDLLAITTGSIGIYVNGVKVGSQEVITKDDSTVFPGPGGPLPVRTWTTTEGAEIQLAQIREYIAAVGRQDPVVVPIGSGVRPGDIISIDTSKLSWSLPNAVRLSSSVKLEDRYNPAFVPLRADFVLRSQHVPRGNVARAATAAPTLNPIVLNPFDPTARDIIGVSGTTVTGQGPVLVRVKVDGATETWAMTDGTSGSWSATLNLLPEGDHLVTATAQVGSLLESAPSVARPVDTSNTLDAPVITYPVDGAVVAPLGEYVGSAIQGTATPGSTITFYGNGGAILTTGPAVVQVNEAGVFVPWVDLSLGENAVYAVASDAFGRVSPPSNTVHISVVAARKTATPTLVGPGDHINTEMMTVTGTAEPGSTVVITAGWSLPPANGTNSRIATTVADSTGNYMSTFTYFEGMIALIAYATAPGCVESDGSPVVWVDVDRTAPTAPFVTILPGLEADGVTRKILRDATTTVSVAYGAQGVVSASLTLNGVPLATQEVNATTISYTGFIDIGTYTLVASVTDAAGNTSSTSRSLVVEVATPAAPTIFTILGDFTSPHAPGGTGTIRVWGIPGAPVRFRLNGTTRLETTIGIDGNLTAAIDLTGLADGTYVLDAIQSPADYYVESPASNTFTFVIDNTVSAAPTINAIPDSITEAALTQGWVGELGLDISGTGVPGSYLDFYQDGSKITWVSDGFYNQVKADGTWSFHLRGTWLDAHLYTLGVAQRTAGRPASSQATESFTVNWTLPPSALPAWGTVPPQAGSSVAVPGTAVAGDTVRVYAHDGGAGNTSTPYGVYSAVADGSGNFSVIVDMSSIATGQSAWLWMTAQTPGSAESPWTYTVRTVQRI